jgi:threonylcarbamoyladenosine tRNA methylthiotransferase CDKAL1
MKLVEEYKFPSLFINQFFPRPGTPAAKMPRIPAQQVNIKQLKNMYNFKHSFNIVQRSLWHNALCGI